MLEDSRLKAPPGKHSPRQMPKTMEDTRLDMPDDIKPVHSPRHEDVDAAAASVKRDLKRATSNMTSEDVPARTFSGAFAAEAAKGNLILFSAILGGFGIFFTKHVFWLTFALIAYEAYIGMAVPAYRLPGQASSYFSFVQQTGVVLRSGKFFVLGIPLLVVIANEGVSNSPLELCNDICRRRAELALYLALGSLLLLETLIPLVERWCFKSSRSLNQKSIAKRIPINQLLKLIMTFGQNSDPQSASQGDPRQVFGIFFSLFCSGVSLCISGIILLIIGGSYATFMGWQSFLLCWAMLVTEALVEGVVRAELLPDWLAIRKYFWGAVLRLVVHGIAFGFLFSKYKHLKYATPALDVNLCDETCQSRLKEMLIGLTILTCIQWIYAFFLVLCDGLFSILVSILQRQISESERRQDDAHQKVWDSSEHGQAAHHPHEVSIGGQSAAMSGDGAATVNTIGTQLVAAMPNGSPHGPDAVNADVTPAAPRTLNDSVPGPQDGSATLIMVTNSSPTDFAVAGSHTPATTIMDSNSSRATEAICTVPGGAAYIV